MTIEQTVEIPVSRKIHLDFEVPFSLPLGKARVELTVIPEKQPEDENVPHRLTAQEVRERGLGFGSGPRMDPYEALEKASGIAKTSGFTSERLFEDRRRVLPKTLF
jgi:hypothetical protein